MICYLDCSQNDCCHNKGGSCCLGGVKVHHAGQSDAVCRSYRNNEAYANAATDNAPPSAETAVRCDDTAAATMRLTAAARRMCTLRKAAAARAVFPVLKNKAAAPLALRRRFPRGASLFVRRPCTLDFPAKAW